MEKKYLLDLLISHILQSGFNKNIQDEDLYGLINDAGYEQNEQTLVFLRNWVRVIEKVLENPLAIRRTKAINELIETGIPNQDAEIAINKIVGLSIEPDTKKESSRNFHVELKEIINQETDHSEGRIGSGLGGGEKDSEEVSNIKPKKQIIAIEEPSPKRDKLAILCVDKKLIDFGVVNSSSIGGQPPKDKLIITNKGEETLKVFIKKKKNATWINLSKDFIELHKDQSVDVWVTLLEEAPYLEKDYQTFHSEIISISSNGGNEKINISYIIERDYFILLWTLVSIFGFSFPAWTTWFFGAWTQKVFSISSLFMVILYGIIIGAGQWILLKKRIEKAQLWFFLTALGYGFGSLIPLILFGLSIFKDPDSGIIQPLIIGLLFGLIPGLLQWIVVRKKYPIAKWIIYSSSISNGMGMLNYYLFSRIFFDEISIIIWGLVYGVITGMTLKKIFISKK